MGPLVVLDSTSSHSGPSFSPSSITNRCAYVPRPTKQITVGKSFGGASDAHDLVRAPVLLRPVPKQKIRQQLLEQRIRADGRHPLRKSGPLVLKSSESQPLSDDEEAGPVGAAVPRVSASGAQEPGSSCAEEPGASDAEEQLAGNNDQ